VLLSRIRSRRAGRLAVAVTAAAVAGVPVVAITAWGATGAAATSVAQPTCTQTINAKAFASAAELRQLNATLAGFGLRSPGSASHNKVLAWLDREFRQIPGMKVRSDYYTINRWQPLPLAKGMPGRDLARAGGLQIVGAAGALSTVPVAGALPFTLPTSSRGTSGRLVYIPTGQAITTANARGKVIVTPFPPAATAYALFRVVAHFLTPDFPSSGDYARPYAAPIDPMLIAAGQAGAVGVVFVWNVPGAQVKGYWEPHSGTRFRVSGVYVGNEQASRLKQLAQQGATARIIVRAKWDTARTRNIIATLPGQTRSRIVINSHTDGVTWVQENGTAGALALARYFARLPRRCRYRDLQFALTSDHLGFRDDGTFRYGAQLDKDYKKGTVDFVMSMEHLGTREILPTGGPHNTLRFDGKAEPLVWSVGEESPAMVTATIAAIKRRKLDRTAVLKGTDAPTANQVPAHCSQGGIGSNFQARLLPTMSTITGPWSLWAPSFGEKAIDFQRMRAEVIAMGDVVRSLDRVPRTTIAGSYPKERTERAHGAKTCSLGRPPAVAPK
jgi:hypothetical protein